MNKRRTLGSLKAGTTEAFIAPLGELEGSGLGKGAVDEADDEGLSDPVSVLDIIGLHASAAEEDFDFTNIVGIDHAGRVGYEYGTGREPATGTDQEDRAGWCEE